LPVKLKNTEEMETKVLDKQTSNKISFIAFIIPEFASGYKMSMPKAYLYLKQFGGLIICSSTGGRCIPTTLAGLSEAWHRFAVIMEGTCNDCVSRQLYEDKRNRFVDDCAPQRFRQGVLRYEVSPAGWRLNRYMKPLLFAIYFRLSIRPHQLLK
jgi:hypothetical protein